MNDSLTDLESCVRIEPTANIRFLVEELRRYGIKTSKTTEKKKTLFFQSAHLIIFYPNGVNNEITYPEYALVSFKDLFKIIGKNDEGVDDQDRVRIWVIATKLENRGLVSILGTSKQLLDEDDEPDLPDVYANLHHVHRNDKDLTSYSYKSKFATNKAYRTTTNQTLYGVSDYFVLV